MDLDVSWLSDYNISYDILHEKLNEALRSNNLLDMSRLVALIDLLQQSDNRKFTRSLSFYQELYEEYAGMKAEWLRRLNDWKDSLKVNDQFDNFHEIDKKWYRVKLLHRDGDMIRVSLIYQHHLYQRLTIVIDSLLELGIEI
jgi:hypothetical protein